MSSGRRKVLLGALTGLILAAVLAVVLPYFIPWDRLEARLVDQVEAGTGRKLTIDGGLSLRLLPWPAVRARKVALSTTTSDEQGQAMITADLAHLVIDPITLITGKLRFTELILEAPRIRLDRFSDGTANWSFVGRFGNGPETSPEYSLGVHKITAVGGSVTYYDHRSGLVRHLSDLNATIFAQSLSGPFQASGNVSAVGMPWHFRIGIDALAEGRGIACVASLGVYDTAIDFAGVLSGYPEQPLLSGSLSGRSADLATLFGGPEPVDGDPVPVVIDGVANLTERALSVEDLVVEIGTTVGTTTGRGALEVSFGPQRRAQLTMRVERFELDWLAAVTGRGDSAAHFVPPPSVTVDVDVEIGELVQGADAVRNVKLAVALTDGSFDVAVEMMAEPAGGHEEADGDVEGTSPPSLPIPAPAENLRRLIEDLLT
ncbi:MAG: AsmA family protein [Alphaproteobacteria bacterium]|nr:AsmA family protein [Alphaproteobacteria bacterium]